MEVPAELKAGDRLHVKVPYPEKHNGIVASPPPDNLYRIVADNTNFFYGSENGKLMYPAFDVADKLVSDCFVCLFVCSFRWLVGWLVTSIYGHNQAKLIIFLLRFVSWVSSLAKRITGKKTTLTWNCQLL